MDKPGKNTGPGKIQERVTQRPNVLLIADLFNYNTDGNLIKPEHKKWIDEKLKPLLKTHKCHVKLRGTASQVGDAAYNQNLSLERILRIKKYLTDLGFDESQVPGQEMQAAGESLSTSKNPNDEHDRAVRIVVAVGRKILPAWPTIVFAPDILKRIPDPKPGQGKLPNLPLPFPGMPRPKPSDPPPGSGHRFRIKQVGSLDMSIPGVKAGASVMGFRIQDLDNGMEVTCTGAGANGGILATPSLTLEGPWNHFQTSKPHELSEFNTNANSTSFFVVGSSSTNIMTVLLKPDFLATATTTDPSEIVTFELRTGTTFGAALVSTTVVGLSCSSPSRF